MTFEQFGIGLLCVLQGVMWWRSAKLARTRYVDTFHRLRELQVKAQNHDEQLDAIATDVAVARSHALDFAWEEFGAMCKEMRVKLLRKRCSDAGKPRSQRRAGDGAVVQPSEDPIGPVNFDTEAVST